MIHAKTLGALALSSGMLVSTAAFADLSAVATTDLNIRSGPGPRYEVVGVIPQGEDADISGCTDQFSWCQVSYNGKNGWSSSKYLSSTDADSNEVIALRKTDEIPVVEFNGPGAAAGAAGGAVLGALVGGPVGAAIGGAVGAGIGISAPPPSVESYVVANRVEPVFLEGEVVIGAQVPAEVELRTIPDYEYRYAIVNGQTVLVEPSSKQIVYIYR